jgi:flavodoxin
MNAQIIYATMTGHSRKIAQAIANKTGMPIYDINKEPKIQPCDLLFIVGGIYGGEYKAELLEFAKNLPVQNVKRIALLTSSTRNSAQGSLRRVLNEAGHTVEEKEFLCKGSFLFKSFRHPNQSEIDDAVKFVEELMKSTAHN